MKYFLDMLPFGDKGEGINLLELTPEQVDILSDAGFTIRTYSLAEGEPALKVFSAE